jgi:hypothetical protein
MKKITMLFICFGSVQSFAQNIGVGTLTPDKAKLVVDGSPSLAQAVFGGAGNANVMVDLFPPKIGFNTYYQSGFKSWITGYSSLFNHDQSNGRITLQTSPTSVVAGAAQSFLTGLTIDAAQNVGIGNIIPAFKLDVGGRARYRTAVLNDLSQTPGAWYDDYRNGNITAFAGMQDSIRWGLYGGGVGGSGWKFDFNTRTGHVGIGQNADNFSALALNGTTALSFYTGANHYGGVSYNATTTDMIVSSSYGSTLIGGSPAKNLLLNPPNCSGIFCTFFPGKVGVGVDIPTASFHVGGNMMIGAGAPATGYQLSINGKMICEELKVQLDAAWPDYVFESNYDLPTLESLEASIKKDKHLPGIPSAIEVKKNGLEVGDMQKRLLEKVEELTLYVIEINKENKQLKKEVEILKATIK